MKLSRTGILFFLILQNLMLQGCGHKISNNLEVTLVDKNICIYTEQKYENVSDNYFVVFVSQVDFSREYTAFYEKDYRGVDYPNSKSSCVKIPLSEFSKKNQGYIITLDTGSTPNVARICISENNDIRKLLAGNENCN